jgi:hypothetical protein
MTYKTKIVESFAHPLKLWVKYLKLEAGCGFPEIGGQLKSEDEKNTQKNHGTKTAR